MSINRQFWCLVESDPAPQNWTAIFNHFPFQNRIVRLLLYQGDIQLKLPQTLDDKVFILNLLEDVPTTGISG